VRIERIDRIGLELGTESNSRFHIDEDDPLGAVNELRRTWTMSREAWQVRIETQMQLSCNRDVFVPVRLAGGFNPSHFATVARNTQRPIIVLPTTGP
jgi:hypothetical protein